MLGTAPIALEKLTTQTALALARPVFFANSEVVLLPQNCAILTTDFYFSSLPTDR
jgi:hypothetical protein